MSVTIFCQGWGICTYHLCVPNSQIIVRATSPLRIFGCFKCAVCYKCITHWPMIGVDCTLRVIRAAEWLASFVLRCSTMSSTNGLQVEGMVALIIIYIWWGRILMFAYIQVLFTYRRCNKTSVMMKCNFRCKLCWWKKNHGWFTWYLPQLAHKVHLNQGNLKGEICCVGHLAVIHEGQLFYLPDIFVAKPAEQFR